MNSYIFITISRARAMTHPLHGENKRCAIFNSPFALSYSTRGQMLRFRNYIVNKWSTRPHQGMKWRSFTGGPVFFVSFRRTLYHSEWRINLSLWLLEWSEGRCFCLWELDQDRVFPVCVLFTVGIILNMMHDERVISMIYGGKFNVLYFSYFHLCQNIEMINTVVFTLAYRVGNVKQVFVLYCILCIWRLYFRSPKSCLITHYATFFRRLD